MATENAYQRTETLPPNYLAQFYSGVPGQNVPGIMPLLNQELVNRMMGFGVEGANPYTYSGNRIAGFTPAQQEAFRMTAGGMGSYLPYFQRGEQLTEQGVGDVREGYGLSKEYIDKAVAAGEMSTDEAQKLLRQVPGMAGAATAEGTQLAREGADVLGGATGVTTGALGRLDEAAGVGYGATGRFDPSNTRDFYNPYEQDVVQQTLKDVREGLSKQDIGRRAQAIGQGAFGGSRSRLMGEELARAAGRGAVEQIGALRAGGYQDASRRAQAAYEAQQARRGSQAGLLAGLGAQQSDVGARLGQLGGARAGLGAQIAGMGGNLAGTYGTAAGGLASLGGNLSNIYGGAGRDVFGTGAQMGQFGAGAGQQMAGFGQGVSGLLGTDIARMGGMGAMQQDLDQRGLDLGYQNFVGQYNLPLQTIGQVGGLATGWAPSMGGTTLQQTQGGSDSNPWMQAVGAGLTAYGAMKPPYGYAPYAQEQVKPPIVGPS